MSPNEMPRDVKNEKLYQTMRQLIEKGMSFIQPFLNSNMFGEFLQRTKKEYPHVSRFVEERLPRYFDKYYIHLVTEEHKDEMQGLPEYTAYKEVVHTDSIISRHFRDKVGNRRFNVTLYDWNFFYFILDSMLESYFITGRYDNKLFNQLYCDLQKFLYNEEIPLTIVAPLHNFRSHASAWNLDFVDLDDGLLIRKITEEERNLYWKKMAWSRLKFGDIGMFEYVIQYRTTSAKFVPREEDRVSEVQSIDEAQKILDRVITSLRLQHSGTVGYSYIECRDTQNTPVQIGDSLSRGPFESYGSDKFWLVKSDVDKVKGTYYQLKNAESSENLPLFLAPERFNSSYRDSSMEDKIIDFAISYEVLFSKQKEGTDSVTHKLAVRFSRLVTENYQQRIEYYQKMKDLYGKRSDIVHGNIKDTNKKDKESVATEFEKMMRMGLSKYIEQFESGNYPEHSELIRKIDFG